MKTLSQNEANRVHGSEGLSQYHREEIQTSNWPAPYYSSSNSQNGERLNWYLATQRQFERFLVR